MSGLKVLPFQGKQPDKGRALSILDDMRAKIESGELIAFAAVGIEPDDELKMWTASTVSVSRLRMIGAIARLHTCYTLEPV
jgi:hypothetical protein